MRPGGCEKKNMAFGEVMCASDEANGLMTKWITVKCFLICSFVIFSSFFRSRFPLSFLSSWTLILYFVI